jgi:hypothetical protein
MAITLLVAVLLAGLARAFVFQSFWIPSSSMVPTLSVNDRILIQKAFFSWHDVREGDIVVFTQPPLDHCGGAQSGDLVKRVVGQPHLRGRPAAGRALPAALRPARAADPGREQPAPLPGAVRRVLHDGRQPRDLM